MKLPSLRSFFVAFSFLQALLYGRGSLRFILGIIFSFAFSIAVILCTVGLMDGFEHTLKRALKLSSGDLSLYSKRGFFVLPKRLEELWQSRNVAYSPLIKTEGFLVQDDFSKGVIIQGVEESSFVQISGLGISLTGNEMALGKALAEAADLAVGDEVVLVLASGKKQLSSLPALHGFRIKQIVDHQIYDKNMRLTYVNLGHLQSLLGLREKKVNLVALNKFASSDPDLVQKVQALKADLTDQLDPLMVIRPFWQEFAPLLEAVEIEKFAMTFILQLIVIIAIFNVVAFVTFLNEQKSRDIFLFQALGTSQKSLIYGWLMLLMMIWVGSCLLAMGFSSIFEWAMLNLSFLELPGDIYSLSRIQIKLSLNSYLIAFCLAFLWLIGISWPGLSRLRKKSLLSRLRLEFHQ